MGRKRKIFLIGAAEGLLGRLPWGDEAFLESCGLERTDDVAAADIIGARGLKEVTEVHVKPGRPVVTWTHEPKWDLNEQFIIRDYLGGGDAHVHNVYNWNVYGDNYYYAPSGSFQEPIDPASIDPAALKAAKVAVFATYRTYPVVIRGESVALDEYRGRMALDLHALGSAVIHGRGWPPGVAVGDTRGVPNWGDQKIADMTGFRHNLCCENTRFDYYVTEKLWHAMKARALPLYLPNDTICEDFPEETLVDLSAFSDAVELVDFLSRMTVRDYAHRLNRCFDIYNRISALPLMDRSRERARRKLRLTLTGV